MNDIVSAAGVLGRKGAAARNKKLTAKQRKDIATKGGYARWGRQPPPNGTPKTIAASAIARVNEDGLPIEKILEQFATLPEMHESMAEDCGAVGDEIMDDPTFAVACRAAAKILRYALEQ